MNPQKFLVDTNQNRVEQMMNCCCMNNEICKESVEIIKSRYKEICIWGAGAKGTGDGYVCLRSLGIKPDYYCDNSEDKWGRTIKDGLVCISPKELERRSSVFVFILTGEKNYNTIISQLEEMNHHDYLCAWELESSDYVLECFLNRKIEKFCNRTTVLPYREYRGPIVENRYGKKIAIYTCIVDDYDFELEPPEKSKEVDYYLISDHHPGKDSKWIGLDCEKIIPSYIDDPIRKNRFAKTHGCEIFANYEKSIYIDGNIRIEKKIEDPMFFQTGTSGIGMFRMPVRWRDDPYIEGLCVADRRDRAEVIQNQLLRYREEGLPRHLGVFEAGVIVRENANPLTIRIMHDWWKEIFENSYRDQVSLMYALWKNNCTGADVFCLGENLRECGYFTQVSRHSGLIEI